ncbi:MAG: hypothetical protein FJ225_03465 [Lentisphaerae bacterium]|nr:hypothetical protein [Lentisphaerota bacterium]
MKNVMMAAGCAAVVLSLGTMAVRAQDDVAALKAQVQELQQKVGDRNKAIEALPAVVAAKQAVDAASAARKQFETSNTAYAELVKAREDAKAAYGKAVETAAANDEQYTTAKRQADELEAKDNVPRDKLKTATPEERPALEAEIASLKAQQQPLRNTMAERMKAMEALPEVVAAKKASDDAKAARDGFATVNPEYAKLLSDVKAAQEAYRKAQNDAQAADAERTALQTQISELQKKIDAAK